MMLTTTARAEPALKFRQQTTLVQKFGDPGSQRGLECLSHGFSGVRSTPGRV